MARTNLNIAVLGGSGFIGTHIVNHLQKDHYVISVTRETLNLSNKIEVDRFFGKNFDIIINCATTGLKQINLEQSIKDAQNNLNVFMNFFINDKIKFEKFINIGSGAEFDASQNIDNALEKQIFDCNPSDSYGWSKNIISRLCSTKYNFFTIRLFGCFSSGEPFFRLFQKILNASKTGEQINLKNDRYFDYVSFEDFLIVLDYFINNNIFLDRDVNCVYREKRLLSHIVNDFIKYKNIDPKIINIISKTTLNYTGSNYNLQKLKLPLTGLEHGLLNYGI